MIEVPCSSDIGKDFDLREFCVTPYKETRGYMYILYDEIFPDYIKVGRTSDCYKRLIGYNSDKPYPTAKMLYISKLFSEVNEAERKILKYMYDNTAPTTLSREWFPIENKQMIIDIIRKAEKELY